MEKYESPEKPLNLSFEKSDIMDHTPHTPRSTGEWNKKEVDMEYQTAKKDAETREKNLNSQIKKSSKS